MRKTPSRKDWNWDGGRPSINLLNTLRDRKTGELELLLEPADLAEWLVAAELLESPVEVSALVRSGKGETSASVRERVSRARAVQLARARQLKLQHGVNSLLSGAELERVVHLEPESRKLIEAAVNRLGLSARAFSKVLRVARTIADLENEEHVRTPHVAEAIQGRLLGPISGRSG